VKTLFGIIESKTEARDRAKALCGLYASLRDAPGALACRQSQIQQLQSFIDRSAKRSFDYNWWDGFQRLIGYPEDWLTDRDEAAMHRDKSYWKKDKYAFGGPQIIRCKLHPKELALLKAYQVERQEEIAAIEANVPLLQAQADELRRVGPFPKELAERYQLTEDGQPARKP
jgi:hypothetical protein